MRRRDLLTTFAAATTASAASYRIVDSHVHVWKADPRYPWAAGASTPNQDATPEMLLALMKQHGVARTVIIQVIYYKWDNRYLADVLKQYPKLFHGVARVNPEDPAAPDHLSDLVERQGFRGVRLSPNTSAASNWFQGPLMPPLWKRCEQLRVPMTLLMPPARCPDAAKLIEAHPDLTVVIDHMTDCPIDQPKELDRLLALARFPKVFVKISHTWSLSRQAYPWRDAHDHVRRLYAAYGPQRLMWGTDWPVSERHATYAQTLNVVRKEMSFLNPEDKSWILSRTIERVWPFS